ncbi:hypothetical protein Pelo_4788 [Pelomyxa schiedti]|nr:hypothetical protein Pelo_4788 [Pelomyxa schiedti]
MSTPTSTSSPAPPHPHPHAVRGDGEPHEEDGENAPPKCYVVAPSPDALDRLVRAAPAEGGEDDAAATRRGGRRSRGKGKGNNKGGGGGGAQGGAGVLAPLGQHKAIELIYVDRPQEFQGCAQGTMKAVLVVCTPNDRAFFDAIPETLELLYGSLWAKNRATHQPFLFFVAGFDPDHSASHSLAPCATIGLLECFAMASMVCADTITEWTGATTLTDILREAHKGAKIGGFSTKTQFEPNPGSNTAANGPESFRYSWTTRDSQSIISQANGEVVIDIGFVISLLITQKTTSHHTSKIEIKVITASVTAKS